MTPLSNVKLVTETRGWQVLRCLLTFLLVLFITAFAALLVLSWWLQNTAKNVFSFQNAVAVDVVGFTLAIVVLAALGAGGLVCWRRWLAWRGLLIGWLGALAVVFWLGGDDARVRRPLTVEQFSPEFTGAKESYAWLMHYTSGQPSAETNSFLAKEFRDKFIGAQTKDKTKWLKVVAEDRHDIEVMWAALEPQHHWMIALNKFERIADLTPLAVDAKLMRFDVWRTMSQYLCARATLLALDGKGDEAVVMLLPLIEVAHKLQPEARTIVRMMIAVTVERTAVDTALMILEHAAVSPGVRQQLAMLMEQGDANEGARRLVLAEYIFHQTYMGDAKLGDALTVFNGLRRSWVQLPLNFLSPLVINPVATTNCYGDHIFVLADLAGARKLAEFAIQEAAFKRSITSQGGIKNLGGRFILGMSLPGYGKILEHYWSTQDQRAALLARCTAGDTPVVRPIDSV